MTAVEGETPPLPADSTALITATSQLMRTNVGIPTKTPIAEGLQTGQGEGAVQTTSPGEGGATRPPTDVTPGAQTMKVNTPAAGENGARSLSGQRTNLPATNLSTATQGRAKTSEGGSRTRPVPEAGGA